jgi:hypothetical protein
LARLANEEERWGVDLRNAKVRVAEYHNYCEGGALAAMDHCDEGRHTFSSVLPVTLPMKCTRALTFENFCLAS